MPANDYTVMIKSVCWVHPGPERNGKGNNGNGTAKKAAQFDGKRNSSVAADCHGKKSG